MAWLDICRVSTLFVHVQPAYPHALKVFIFLVSAQRRRSGGEQLLGFLTGLSRLLRLALQPTLKDELPVLQNDISNECVATIV